jgi:hypothetical protein
MGLEQAEEFVVSLDDFGNQILVAITTILTVIAFAFSIESNLPKVPYVTYIDAFFLCCYFFVFLTVIELMVVNIVLRTGAKELAIKIRRSARWSVTVVFAVLNAILIPHFFCHDEKSAPRAQTQATLRMKAGKPIEWPSFQLSSLAFPLFARLRLQAPPLAHREPQ